MFCRLFGTIVRTNAALSIRTQVTYFSDILFAIENFSFVQKTILKTSSAYIACFIQASVC